MFCYNHGHLILPISSTDSDITIICDITCRYGDTTPRSIQARIFGLVWIVVGITILSVFTATVTTVLTQSSLISHNALHGIRVSTRYFGHFRCL